MSVRPTLRLIRASLTSNVSGVCARETATRRARLRAPADRQRDTAFAAPLRLDRDRHLGVGRAQIERNREGRTVRRSFTVRSVIGVWFFRHRIRCGELLDHQRQFRARAASERPPFQSVEPVVHERPHFAFRGDALLPCQFDRIAFRRTGRCTSRVRFLAHTPRGGWDRLHWNRRLLRQRQRRLVLRRMESTWVSQWLSTDRPREGPTA